MISDEKMISVIMFDGDEMNIHLAQSVQTRNELKHIANVKLQIIGAKDSSPIIGCVQDALSGAYLLTQPEVKIKGSDVANFLCNTSSETKHEIDINKIYTGHEIFSHIIPKGINIYKKDLEIIDGKLKTGVLNKSTLSKVKNSIIHFIWDKYGPEKTRRFIDDSQKLVLSFLSHRGFTFGFGDCMLNKDVRQQLKQMITNKLLEYKITLTQYENDTDQIGIKYVENILNSELVSFGINSSQILMNNLNTSNNLFVTVKSGSKGNETNLQQILGVRGQINVEGVRIKKKVENRSLPIYHRDDDTPEARGFVVKSYFEGLHDYEYFYDAMAGREGLIDTAIKTAKTGYVSRQLIKGLEDLSIKYDNTNRNSRNIIIQYVYGGNGIDQSRQTQLMINMLSMNNSKIDEVFGFNDKEISKLEKELKIKDLDKFNTYYTNKIKKYRDELRVIQYKANSNYKTLEEKYFLPVNLLRIVQDYTHKKENIELSPKMIDDSIEELLNSYDTKLLPYAKNTDKHLLQDDRALKYLLEIAIHDYLCPKKCIFEYGLTKKDFDNIIKDIKQNFIKALVIPGEMVGIVAAQSIGEPTSQLTLNTKHSAGKAKNTNINSGVSRIEELLHFSKDIKTPIMTVYFDEAICSDKNKVNKISSYFKYLTIKELIDSAEIYYDMNLNDELSKKINDDNVSNPFFINNQKVEINTLPLLFRLKLNMEKLHDKETTLLDIKTKFISYWHKNFNLKNRSKTEKEIFTKISRCAILSNNDKVNQIIHIRFNMSSFNYNMLTEFLKIVLDEITLKGIDNIKNIDINNELKLTFDSKSGDKIENKEWVVSTSGINYEKLKYIKGIDMKRTTCNDINTIFRLYGIEAARQILLNEFLFAYQSSVINQNHLSVLIDMMTHMGFIISIDRHGLNKVESDPFSKASFEKTMDHFVNAAIFNEHDTANSVSSRILLGRVINGGTGAFDLLLDTEKLENSEYTKNESGGRVTYGALLEEESLFKDIIKFGVTKNDFFLPVK